MAYGKCGVIMDINHIWGVFEIWEMFKSRLKNKERQDEIKKGNKTRQIVHTE